MSRFKLKGPVAPNVTGDAKDIIGTKTALNSLGYYRHPSGGKLGGWVDSAMFDAIRNFQQDNGLDVDGMMRPGGPTEAEVNRRLAETRGTLAEPGDKMPVIVPPNVDPGMPILTKPFGPDDKIPPYVDENGHIILEGKHPKTGAWVRPHKRT
ncbi:peptidoglycan-binding domain-containing protein [Shumkonia mesophila]|uniref:peptidoglycan-binding domain-containing protein n=1 Tax=Shumkonia mesophila TaxID=2838854 RepID=UPI002934B6E9|nr:peptidoglycan-binding domain-containing protein [Shumkonia mesophila]